MPATPRLGLQRLLLLVVASGLALALAEGALSLAADRSLLRLLRGGGASSTGAAPRSEAERRQASAGNAGPYAVHRDPLVGYVLRAEAEVEIHGARVRTDALGLRRRTGPESAGAEPLRVAVLGDSVAFGFGLPEHEVLAEQLERRLTELRPSDAPPVECRTVALPGWNVRNAVTCLLDHWDALRPDLVVCLPITNDLDDTNGLLESGHLRPAPDVAQPDPWLCTVANARQVLQRRMLAGRDPAALAELAARAGPQALLCDLGPESSRRYDENARLIAGLRDRLDASGGRLLVASFNEAPDTWHLQARLLAGERPVPVTTLFTWLQPDMVLPGDPHPSADTVAAAATWIAEEIVARGWVPTRLGAALPDPDARFLAVRAAQRPAAEVAQLAASAREKDRAALRSVVDFTSFEGIEQVYGNLNRDGSAGTRLLALLAPGGPRLHVELAALPGRADLCPLEVRVEADGVLLGTMTIEAGATVRGDFALPDAADAQLAREVRLVPERWVTVMIRDVPQLAAFVPRRIAVGE
jgi:hypothetical protein